MCCGRPTPHGPASESVGLKIRVSIARGPLGSDGGEQLESPQKAPPPFLLVHLSLSLRSKRRGGSCPSAEPRRRPLVAASAMALTARLVSRSRQVRSLTSSVCVKSGGSAEPYSIGRSDPVAAASSRDTGFLALT
jgi:hypothetical protein